MLENKLIEYVIQFNGKKRATLVADKDISENEFKGIRATGMSKRDVPARPIKLENTSENENVSKFRYAYSGEPIKDNFITDAEAI